MRRQLLTVLSLSSGMDGDDVGAMEREHQADFDELQRQEDQREREQFGAQPHLDDEAPDVDDEFDDGGDGDESPDDQGSESGSEGEEEEFDESEEEEEEDEFAHAAADHDAAEEDDDASLEEGDEEEEEAEEEDGQDDDGDALVPFTQPELSPFLFQSVPPCCCAGPDVLCFL